jgi:L-histidine Nalpha-methyltransferase
MEKEKINDLIFKELIKRGYSLEGKTRIWNIADSKLWYLTPKQAQAYLDLENSHQYKKGVVNAEFELVEGNVKDILNNLSPEPLNVIDLGCGDGKKAAHLIGHLKQKIKKLRYCPIDISGYMVVKAIETVSQIDVHEIIESQYNISDFENLENIIPLLKKGEFKRNLFLLLGYTLGNFEINDLLYQIRNAMDKGDLLLVIDGIGSSKWEQRASTAKDDHKTKMFFDQIPLQLGLKQEDIEFAARFKNSRIEFYHTILKDRTIKFQDRTVQFNKGDQIIVAVAYKHEKDDLQSYMNMWFDVLWMKLSKDKSTALVLCEK